VRLVHEHAELLSKALPARYSKHPLDDVKDLLTELGLPFLEKPGSGSDDNLEWNPADAITSKH